MVAALLVDGKECRSGDAKGGNIFGLASKGSFKSIIGYDSLYPDVLDVCEIAESSSHDPSALLPLIAIRNR